MSFTRQLHDWCVLTPHTFNNEDSKEGRGIGTPKNSLALTTGDAWVGQCWDDNQASGTGWWWGKVLTLLPHVPQVALLGQRNHFQKALHEILCL